MWADEYGREKYQYFANFDLARALADKMVQNYPDGSPALAVRAYVWPVHTMRSDDRQSGLVATDCDPFYEVAQPIQPAEIAAAMLARELDASIEASPAEKTPETPAQNLVNALQMEYREYAEFARANLSYVASIEEWYIQRDHEESEPELSPADIVPVDQDGRVDWSAGVDPGPAAYPVYVPDSGLVGSRPVSWWHDRMEAGRIAAGRY